MSLFSVNSVKSNAVKSHMRTLSVLICMRGFLKGSETMCE